MSQSQEKGFTIRGVPTAEQNLVYDHFEQKLGTHRASEKGNRGSVSVRFLPGNEPHSYRGLGKLASIAQSTRYIFPAEYSAAPTAFDEFDAHVLDVADGELPSYVALTKSVRAQVTGFETDGTFNVSLSSKTAKAAPHKLSGFKSVDVPGANYTYWVSASEIDSTLSPSIPEVATTPSSQCTPAQSQDFSQISAFGVNVPLGRNSTYLEKTITSLLPCTSTRKEGRTTFYCDPATTVVEHQATLGDMREGKFESLDVLFCSKDLANQFKDQSGDPISRGFLIAHRYPARSPGPSAAGASKSVITVISDVNLTMPTTGAAGKGCVTLSDKYGSIPSYPNQTHRTYDGFVIPTWTAARAQPTARIAASPDQGLSPGQEKGFISEGLIDLLNTSEGA